MEFDDYGEEDYDHNYFYVEDSYDAADDLAEHAVPSPQPFDDQDEWDELSRFEYWADIEYDSDGWNDVDRISRHASSQPLKAQAGQKRKAAAPQSTNAKRRRALGDNAYINIVADREQRGGGTIRWRTADQNLPKPENVTQPITQLPGKPFALLKDWKKRFANDNGFYSSPANAAEIDWEDASSEAEPQNTPRKSGSQRINKRQKKGKSAADRPVLAAPKSPADDVGSLLAASGLDPAVLRAVLETKLAASGAAPGMDADMLLKFAARMLGGSEEADDIAGELAEELLGGEGEGDDATEDESADAGDPVLAEWVSRQKARTEDTRKDSSIDVSGFEAPPSDAEGLADGTASHSHTAKNTDEPERTSRGQQAAFAETSSTSTSKKRKNDALQTEEPDHPQPKRERRGFEKPTASSKARTAKSTTASSASGRGKGK